jgi:hypothetical protein
MIGFNFLELLKLLETHSNSSTHQFASASLILLKFNNFLFLQNKQIVVNEVQKMAPNWGEHIRCGFFTPIWKRQNFSRKMKKMKEAVTG